MTVAEQVRATLIEYAMVTTGDTIVVGLSGGADSVTLLHVLRSLKEEFGFDLCAVHIHHGLRGEEADRDRDFAEKLCDQWDIPFFCFKYDVRALAKECGKGIEEMGRELRYQAFNEVASRFPCSRIATAHTADDQIETVLLRLCRGCGLHGLTGIPAVRGNIVRPLLHCHRTAIEEYCEQHSLSYVTDSTNTDDEYTRNRIRHHFVPLLSTVHPNAKQAILRLSSQASETERFLQTLCDPIFRQLFTDKPHRFHRKPILETDSFLQKYVLQELMRKNGIPAGEQHLLDMCRALVKGGTVSLPNGISFVVSRSYITLTATRATVDSYRFFVCSKEEYEQKLNISKEVFKNCCDYDMICGDVQIRYRIEGDTYRPAGRGCQKTLRKLFNEQEVPKPIRSTIPLVCDKHGIVIVGGFGCDERVAITENTKRVLVLEKTEE